MKLVSIETVQGVAVAARVAVASTFVQRFRGLLGRRQLASNQGLLLRPGGSIHTLTMRFVIDAVFLDRDQRVIAITHRLAPNRVAVAPRKTRSVLELAGGRAEECGLAPGMTLTFRSEAGA